MRLLCFLSDPDLSPVSSASQRRTSPVMYSSPFVVARSRELYMIDTLTSTQGCSRQPRAKRLLVCTKPLAQEARALMHDVCRLFSLGKCMLVTWHDGWAVISGVRMSSGLKGAVTRGVFSSERLGWTHTGSWHLPWIADLCPCTSSLSLFAITTCTAKKRFLSLCVQHWNIFFFYS